MPNIPIANIDSLKRQLLTPRNLAELGVTPESVQQILQSDRLKLNTRLEDGKWITVSPVGLSINETTFGDYSGPTASALGYNAYFNIGAPLVEERADIVQPPADVLSVRAYENRGGNANSFTDTVEFSISNTLNWSLGATGQLTLSDSVTEEVSAQLQKSLMQSIAAMTSATHINHDHKDNVGSEDQTQISKTFTDEETDTATGTATGSATESAQLQLGVTGQVGGSVTTSWTSTSSVSGNIPQNSVVETMATQRRQVRQYTYEFPVNFGGYVALQYPNPVSVQRVPPQSDRPNTSTVIAQDIQLLELREKNYRPKGVAETVSALAVQHTVFGSETIDNLNQDFNDTRPHNLPENKLAPISQE